MYIGITGIQWNVQQKPRRLAQSPNKWENTLKSPYICTVYIAFFFRNSCTQQQEKNVDMNSSLHIYYC